MSGMKDNVNGGDNGSGNRASLEAELGYIDKILDHTTDDDGFIYFKILLGDGSVVWKKNENMNCDASKIIAYWSRFAKNGPPADKEDSMADYRPDDGNGGGFSNGKMGTFDTLGNTKWDSSPTEPQTDLFNLPYPLNMMIVKKMRLHSAMNFSKTCKMSRMLFNKRNNPGDHLFKIVAARKPWICRGAAHIMKNDSATGCLLARKLRVTKQFLLWATKSEDWSAPRQYTRDYLGQLEEDAVVWMMLFGTTLPI